MRILYSVCGRGIGHATRSKPIIQYLEKKKHKVKIFSSGTAYSYLKNNFNDVNKMQKFYTEYKNDCVDEFGTVLVNVINFPKITTSFNKLAKAIDIFKPHIVISDCEEISANVALFKGIPIISISNIDMLNKTNVKYPKKYFLNYFEKKLLNRLTIPYAKYRFIPTFFYPKSKSRYAFIVPPVLRDEIINTKTKSNGYFLVYQSVEKNKKLIDALKKMNEKFIVYGSDKNKINKNITLRKFNEKTFFKDLANCKAVITNGGFTLISEAIHLGKPVLSIPLRRHIEQIINAFYLDELGYGKSIEFVSKKDIKDFINNLDKYKKNLKKYKREDNSKLLNKLNSIIESISYTLIT